MLTPSSTFIATLIALPAIFAQSNNTTNGNTNTTAGAPPTAAPVDANNSSTTRNPSANASFSPTPFTPSLASGTTCGTAQQNLNQCITKVGKDISSCTDNVCLCQTYANIAACYNGCPELSSQSDAYQGQSAQLCNIAGVKPNTTATAVTATTPSTNTSTTPSTSNTTPVRNGSSTNSSSNASTFSAAKSPASFNSPTSVAGVFAALVAAMSVVVA